MAGPGPPRRVTARVMSAAGGRYEKVGLGFTPLKWGYFGHARVSVSSLKSQVSSLKSQVSSFQDESGRNMNQWDWDWDAVGTQERGFGVGWDADWDWRGAPPLSLVRLRFLRRDWLLDRSSGGGGIGFGKTAGVYIHGGWEGGRRGDRPRAGSGPATAGKLRRSFR